MIDSALIDRSQLVIMGSPIVGACNTLLFQMRFTHRKGELRVVLTRIPIESGGRPDAAPKPHEAIYII
jgi:hypothetical protein